MEFISKYMRIIKSVLWVLIIVFAYKVYGSINGPIEFNKVKKPNPSPMVKNSFPKVTPATKGNDLNSPCWAPELINNRLAGPGVVTIINANIKKAG